MSFLNKLRPRSMKRRKAKTSTTAGDIFRGTVEVPNDEPKPTMAEQMAERSEKAQEKNLACEIERIMESIQYSADRGMDSVFIVDCNMTAAASRFLKSQGFKIVDQGLGHAEIFWSEK